VPDRWKDGRSDSANAGYAGAFLGAIFGCLVGLLVGGLMGTGHAYHGRYLEERYAVEPVIEGDPAFKAVEIGERSAGGISLTGSVPTDAAKERLQELVTKSIGAIRASNSMTGVRVDSKP
jgi:hypothetical protein